jgi:hypothetical protein
MEWASIATLGGLFLTFLASIISLTLQLQNRKLIKIEQENDFLRRKLITSLKAIQGYQKHIHDIANKEGINVARIKADIHNKYPEEFIDKEFIQPGKITNLLNRYNF